MSDEASLLRQAREGSTEAIASLLQLHGPAVSRRLEIDRRWRSVLDAEDVMQVTYLEAFLQFGRFDPARGASFDAWLHQIARNNLLDAVRGLSRKRQPQPTRRVHAAAGESEAQLLACLGVTTTTPSRLAGRAESVELMARALARLPADYAAVVRLYDLEGLSIEQVASRMGRSFGAVHMLRARAHDALRGQLGTESNFFSDPA